MFRKTKNNEIEQVMAVIKDGRKFLKEQGINQWQHGAPGRSDVEADLELGTSYVYEIDGDIAATAMLNDYDADYEKYNELWTPCEKYLVAHRVATLEKYRSQGIGRKFMTAIVDFARDENVDYVRIDTHHDNKIMRKFLVSFGFSELGDIELSMKNNLDDTARVAYEYKVEK